MVSRGLRNRDTELKGQNFVILYKDGSAYTGPPEMAPVKRVEIIVQRDKAHKWDITQRFNFYTWDREAEYWLGSDLWGMIDYQDQPGWTKVLRGRQMKPSNWRELYDRSRKIQKYANEHDELPEDLGV